MTGKKLASISLILALLVDVTGHSVAFGVGLRAHDGGTSKSVAVAPYIEDVFSSYLYTGNGGVKTITNGIDLAGKGGMVWVKTRNTTEWHTLSDSVANVSLYSNATNAGGLSHIQQYLSDGFSTSGSQSNLAGNTHVSWTFRKAPKFFDVVTYTGNGANRTISHSLGQTPGFVIVKRRDIAGDWLVNVVAMTGWTDYMVLNTPASRVTDASVWNSASPTSTTFSVGTNANVNASGGSYVAYLFANDTSSESLIKCGILSSASSGDTNLNLGFEPQFLIFKKSAEAGDWFVYDTSRGASHGSGAASLTANTSSSETNGISVKPTANGASVALANSTTYIYLAIRRGPMRTPTSGTQVFLTNDGGGSITGDSVAVGFPVDVAITAYKTLGGRAVNDRLRGFGTTNTAGASPVMHTMDTSGESVWSASNPYFYNAWNTTILRGSNGADPGGGIVTWFFRRAPGVFDVVAYAGTGLTGNAIAHNLGVPPELVIFKGRSGLAENNDWLTLSNFTSTNYIRNLLQSAAALGTNLYSDNAGMASQPTTTNMTVDNVSSTNNGSTNYIAYLFASKAGVSKVGSYTGNGASQTISANFTAGARFILIKRTDAAGDWFVWDSVLGIVAGNDPHLSLNNQVAWVTGDDSVDPDSGGFVVNQDAATNINVNGATYIYLAFQ